MARNDRVRIAETFDRGVDAIRDGYALARGSEQRLRREGKYVRPWDTAENYLKREAYALIARTLDTSGGGRAIQRLVRSEREEPKSPSFAESPFYWGLLLIFDFDCNFDQRKRRGEVGHIGRPKGGPKGRPKAPSSGAYTLADRAVISKISLYAPLLDYAYEHKVPAAYVIGFLHQSGRRPAEARSMVRNNEHEIGFKRLVEQCHFPCLKRGCHVVAEAAPVSPGASISH